VQLDPGERRRRRHRRVEEVADPELPDRPAEELPASLGDGGVGTELLSSVDRHEQLEGDRPLARRQVDVAGKSGLVADGRLAGVAGPLEGGQDAGAGTGVGSEGGAGRDPR
jgi:hypothetical protein